METEIFRPENSEIGSLTIFNKASDVYYRIGVIFRKTDFFQFVQKRRKSKFRCGSLPIFVDFTCFLNYYFLSGVLFCPSNAFSRIGLPLGEGARSLKIWHGLERERAVMNAV